MLAYSGRGRFVVTDLDLNEVVRGMGELLGVTVSKKASVEYRLAKALPPVEGDVAQLQQIVMNLVTNAIKFGPGKPIEIRFDTTKPKGDLGRRADFRKARESLGWSPKVEFEAGIAELYGWMSQRLLTEMR